MYLGLQVPNFTSPEFYSQTIMFALIAYLIGSLNFGHILSWSKRKTGKSLGTSGSKNYGATNAGRVFGVTGFLFVFFGDALKPLMAAAALIGLQGFEMTGYVGPYTEGSISFALLFVIVGHKWPIFYGFKGGKGVSAMFGLFAVFNFYIFLMALAAFSVGIFLTKRVSLSSCIAAIFGASMLTFSGLIDPSWLWYYNSTPTFTYTQGLLVTVWVLAAMIIYNHRVNFIRIIKKEESVVLGVTEARAIAYKYSFGYLVKFFDLVNPFTYIKYDKRKRTTKADMKKLQPNKLRTFVSDTPNVIDLNKSNKEKEKVVDTTVISSVKLNTRPTEEKKISAKKVKMNEISKTENSTLIDLKTVEFKPTKKNNAKKSNKK